VPVGTTLEEAEKLLQRHRIEKLLVVDKDFNLKGLITVKNIQKKLEYPRPPRTTRAVARRRSHRRHRPISWSAPSSSIAQGRLLAMDTAHGHSVRVMEPSAP